MGVGEVETNAANLSVCSRTLVQSPVLCSGWIEGGRPPAAPGRGRGSWCWTSCLHLKISCSVSSIGDIYTTTTTFSHLPTLITTTPSPSALTSQSNKTSEVKSEWHCQTGERREERSWSSVKPLHVRIEWGASCSYCGWDHWDCEKLSAGSEVKTKRHYIPLQRNHQVNELEVTVNNTKPALTSFSDLNWPTIEIISTLTAKFDYWLQWLSRLSWCSRDQQFSKQWKISTCTRVRGCVIFLTQIISMGSDF